MEACRRQGIEPKELILKTYKDFKKSLGVEANSLPKHIIEMRYEHYEQGRKDKIQILIEERQVVM